MLAIKTKTKWILRCHFQYVTLEDKLSWNALEKVSLILTPPHPPHPHFLSPSCCNYINFYFKRTIPLHLRKHRLPELIPWQGFLENGWRQRPHYNIQGTSTTQSDPCGVLLPHKHLALGRQDLSSILICFPLTLTALTTCKKNTLKRLIINFQRKVTSNTSKVSVGEGKPQ